MKDAKQIAAGLTKAQRALLDDICDHPGLYAGQYVHDGAGIEHLPRDLWWQSFDNGASALLGLGKARPSELGLAVRAELEASDADR